MEKNISLAFPTLIGQFRFPEAAEVNAELKRLILEREKAEPGETYSNVGGWHSRGDLLDWPDPRVAVLRGWIGSALNHMVAATVQIMQPVTGRRPMPPLRLTAWANVCRRGHYHRVHNHPGSCWSGVYYVEAGADAPDHPLSGVLELLDPRPYTEMVATPGNPFGQKALVRAEAGRMVIFPGWMYHCVNPYLGEGERISVSFNAQVAEPPTAPAGR